MKKLIIVLIAAACCSGCALTKNIGYAVENLSTSMSVCDGIYYHAADNVKLAVFRCEDTYYANCVFPRDTERWVEIAAAEGMELADGELGFAEADVTFRSGGIDGLHNSPHIDRLILFEKTDDAGLEEYRDITEYGTDILHDREIQLYHSQNETYCVFRKEGYKFVTNDGDKPTVFRERVFADDIFVYHDGEAIGVFGSISDADEALGLVR